MELTVAHLFSVFCFHFLLGAVMGVCQGTLRITCDGLGNSRGHEKVGSQPGCEQSARKADVGSDSKGLSNTVKDTWLGRYGLELHN